MADYPETEGDIQTRLNTINNLIDTYLASPTKFAEMIGGTVKISIPDYVAALQKERDHLVEQLRNYPWMIESDSETSGP